MSYAASGYWASGYAPQESGVVTEESDALPSNGVSTTSAVSASISASFADSSIGISSADAVGVLVASSEAQASDGLAIVSATTAQITAATALGSAGSSTVQAETGADPESTAQTSFGSSSTAAVGVQVFATYAASSDGLASTNGHGGSTSSATAGESSSASDSIAYGALISSSVAVTSIGSGAGSEIDTSGDIAESEALPSECVATCSAIAQAIAGSEIVLASGSCYITATTERREASTWIAATAGQVWQAQDDPSAFSWTPSTTPTQVTWN